MWELAWGQENGDWRVYISLTITWIHWNFISSLIKTFFPISIHCCVAISLYRLWETILISSSMQRPSSKLDCLISWLEEFEASSFDLKNCTLALSHLTRLWLSLFHSNVHRSGNIMESWTPQMQKREYAKNPSEHDDREENLHFTDWKSNSKCVLKWRDSLHSWKANNNVLQQEKNIINSR